MSISKFAGRIDKEGKRRRMRKGRFLFEDGESFRGGKGFRVRSRSGGEKRRVDAELGKEEVFGGEEKDVSKKQRIIREEEESPNNFERKNRRRA